MIAEIVHVITMILCSPFVVHHNNHIPYIIVSYTQYTLCPRPRISALLTYNDVTIAHYIYSFLDAACSPVANIACVLEPTSGRLFRPIIYRGTRSHVCLRRCGPFRCLRVACKIVGHRPEGHVQRMCLLVPSIMTL